MAEASATDWEFSIVLPLGAVAAQLQKIEAQLRHLNMKALDFARDRHAHSLHAALEGRLEQIGATLDSVATLVSDIHADLSPRRAKVTRVAVDEESPIASLDRRGDERPPSRETNETESPRKPHPERDD